MRRFGIRVLLACLCCFWVADAGAADEIRALSLPAIMKLGKELYERDAVAARTTDVVLDTHPEARKILKGWVTMREEGKWRVYYLQETGKGERVVAYIVTISSSGAPVVEAEGGTPIPPAVAKRDAARRTAIRAVPKYWTDRYNFEVLDDPAGKGFLVYALAATTEPKKIIAGGHYRISVSADGSKATRVDALSKSFLVLDKPDDKEVAGTVMSHLVSATPVETHVYLSLLHKLPLYVATSQTDVWRIVEGTITKMPRNAR